MASQVVLVVKNLPANAGDTRDVDLIPGWEDTLEQQVATHSSIFAWKSPWTEELSQIHSMGLQRIGHNGVTEHTIDLTLQVPMQY